MLQKLENLYLAILRFVVILVAGILLAAVIVLGLNSFRALQGAPKEKEATPIVSDDSLKKIILQRESQAEQPNANAKPTSPKSDPNQALYDRAADSIIVYVSTHSGAAENPNRAQVSGIIKSRASKYQKQYLASAYAKAFAESIDRLLKDKDLIAAAKEASALDVVNRLLNAFTEQFEEQVEKNATENQAKHQEYIEKKAEGQQSLYIAAGAFVAFLMIVFLSIIIRIERNLRHLDRAAA
jgi:hypothetical protein